MEFGEKVRIFKICRHGWLKNLLNDTNRKAHVGVYGGTLSGWTVVNLNTIIRKLGGQSLEDMDQALDKYYSQIRNMNKILFEEFSNTRETIYRVARINGIIFSFISAIFIYVLRLDYSVSIFFPLGILFLACALVTALFSFIIEPKLVDLSPKKIKEKIKSNSLTKEIITNNLLNASEENQEKLKKFRKFYRLEAFFTSVGLVLAFLGLVSVFYNFYP